MTFDCQACGACCVQDREHAAPTYVTVEDEEIDRVDAALRRRRLPMLVSPWFQDVLAVATKPEDECTCVALDGTVGVRVGCSIYEDRPSICREFTPGNPSCLRARADAGIQH